MIGERDGYIEEEESNGNKYLTFASSDKNKKVLEKYTKLWDKIKYHIQTINADKSGECNSIEYDKDCMRIKFNSDDDLPLNKILHMLTIIARSVFEENDKYCLCVFLNDCLYEI